MHYSQPQRWVIFKNYDSSHYEHHKMNHEKTKVKVAKHFTVTLPLSWRLCPCLADMFSSTL